ncbi:hypothetical protein Ccrd_001479 [Cynara cardunculus var. scolymus]|uniref:Uncharacterized protein n=1 Tax=Cynara cardunculus var. scolymus TaxID=59895 RepID=A0A103XT56_CYNCS|nr:hypothetical protein Ccrd_001479 [Cynara cardunculus var. scolymus]
MEKIITINPLKDGGVQSCPDHIVNHTFLFFFLVSRRYASEVGFCRNDVVENLVNKTMLEVHCWKTQDPIQGDPLTGLAFLSSPFSTAFFACSQLRGLNQIDLEQEKGRIEVRYCIKYTSRRSVKRITCKKQTTLSNLPMLHHRLKLLGRLINTLQQNSVASSIFDTLKDRLSFSNVS